VKAESNPKAAPPARSFRRWITEYTAHEISITENVLIVAGGYLVVAGAELFAHWLLPFRWIYLLQSPTNGVSMFPDVIFPALVLGWWNGWVGRNCTTRRASWFILPLGSGVAALLPLYAMQVRLGSAVFWWIRTPVETALFLATALFWAALFVMVPMLVYHKDFPI
jgi:hypothetical protein